MNLHGFTDFRYSIREKQNISIGIREWKDNGIILSPQVSGTKMLKNLKAVNNTCF